MISVFLNFLWIKFVLIISKDRQRALIGVAGSKMSFSAGTFRDWAITNFQNVDFAT